MTNSLNSEMSDQALRLSKICLWILQYLTGLPKLTILVLQSFELTTA